MWLSREASSSSAGGSRSVVALKTIPRRDSANAFNAGQAVRERNALFAAAKSESLWLLGLRYAMQDRKNLYLVTDYLPGGDLRALMNRNNGSLSEELTLFFVAEVTMALNSLHKLGFAHLDLRPENVGIDRLGHVKLIDFGAAQTMDADGRIALSGGNLFGCPLYVAPELPLALTKQARSHSQQESDRLDGRKCDFWSLGVCAAEMRIGDVPRGNKAATAKEALQKVEGVSNPALLDLVDGLLRHSPEKRLGYDELVRHAFFLTVDWDELRNSCAPFVPELPAGDEDVSNFEADSRSVESRETETELSSPVRRRAKEPEEDFILGFTFMGKREDDDAVASSTRSSTSGGDRHRLQQLLKENEDLRLKLSRFEHQLAAQRETSLRESGESHQLQQLCEQENKELRTTIARLEKLLQLEREERGVCEKKTLELLRDVKVKWQQREEARVDDIRKEKDEAFAEAARLRTGLNEAQAETETQAEELRQLRDAKNSLKTKLKECREKLVDAVAKCESESARVRELEAAKTDWAETSVFEGQKNEKLKERATAAEKAARDAEDGRKAAEAGRSNVERLLQEAKKTEADLERGLAEARNDLKRAQAEKEAASEARKKAELELADAEKENTLCRRENEEKLRSLENARSDENSSELRLHKVEVRMLEKKNRDLEERVKFLREHMIREEKAAKERLAEENAELKTKLDSVNETCER